MVQVLSGILLSVLLCCGGGSLVGTLTDGQSPRGSAQGPNPPTDIPADLPASPSVEASTEAEVLLSPTPSPTPGPKCHPNYSVCLAVVADLDCSQISQRDFRVVGGKDPYGLDGNDKDGKACETVATTPRPPTTKPAPKPKPKCHPNYSVCLPIVGDIDCGEISQRNFQVWGGSDPYRLDADHDGIACEKS